MKTTSHNKKTAPTTATTLILACLCLTALGIQAAEEKPADQIALSVNEAELTGTINRIPHFNSIGFWYNTKDTVSFLIDDLEKGEYDIWINYGAEPVAGGGSLLLTFNKKELRKQIRPTKKWVDFVDLKVGSVNHDGGEAKIVLRAARISNEALMDMKSVTLKKK